MKDTIGPLDQEALEYGSMMPEGWQTEDRDERAELESANDKVSYHADNAGGAHGKDTNGN